MRQSPKNEQPWSLHGVRDGYQQNLVVKGGSIRPRNDFPSTLIGQKLSKFNAFWYEIHKWLEYSISDDSAHCFYSRCFGTLGKLSELFLFKIFMISVDKFNFYFVDAFKSHEIDAVKFFFLLKNKDDLLIILQLLFITISITHNSTM